MSENSHFELSQTSQPEKTVERGTKYACYLLGAREYSRVEIERKLLTKQYSKETASLICDRLVENNWQSDERYCAVFLRSKVARGQGLNRIRYELRQNGIQDMLLEKVLQGESVDWQQVCDSTLSKKLGSKHLGDDRKLRAKIERFLKYRGFSGEEIRTAIGRKMTATGASISEHDE